jgi:Kelch motif
MANVPFQPGTWISIPTNCTTGFWLTYVRCAEYGVVAITECQQWVANTVIACIEWGWQSTKSCSWWSWLFCVIWAVVVSLVCLVLGVIVIFVCILITVVEYVVCLLWTVFTFWFCISTANGGTAFLLTDGTVMMQEFSSLSIGIASPTWATRRWWKLTPDQFGSYAKGTWSQLADSNVARTYFASGVLADGRVVVCGGEYSDASGRILNDDTNTCEIYDPVANSWTVFDPPKKGSTTNPWTEIGDAPCAVLPDGSLLLGSIDGPEMAKLDPGALTWTSMRPRPDGNPSGEESWVLMPDNTIASPSCLTPPVTWVYHIAADHWVNGNKLSGSVVGPDDNELGPGVLLYDGRAFWLGANDDINATAVYSPLASPNWQNGPDLPSVDDNNRVVKIGSHDGPGSLMLNGNLLFCAGEREAGGHWSRPAWFFEFDGTDFHRTSDPPNNDFFTYGTRLLLLPNGDVLFCVENDSSFYAYHSDAAQPQDSWRPVIQNCPATFQPGTTIQVSGTQFNGLSQAVAYGDDSQTATNYPLVRIVNKQTGHVRYCRTFNHTTVDINGNVIPSMGVATGNAVITTNAEIPFDIDNGDSQLFVVANAIPSAPFDVAIWPILT